MKTLLVMGGTSESRRAAGMLERAGYRVVIAVASSLGARYAVGAEVISGAKDAGALALEAARLGAAALIDGTHPFAVEASRSARSAAGTAGIPYLRFTRPGSEAGPGVSVAQSFAEAVELLAPRGDRALLTIGVRHLGLFTAAGIDIAARVLPQAESFHACREAGVAPEDIIAAFPPFDESFNRACIRKSRARVIVMKDSGSEGGVPEKLAAARAEGIGALLVARPESGDAIHDFDELLVRLEEVLEP